MGPDERDTIVARYRAGWDRPVSDSTLALWTEKLDRLDFVRARQAMEALIDTKGRQPAWSDFKEAYDAARGHGHQRADLPPECGICEDGWVDVTPESEQRAGMPITVAPCPQGCTPPSREERQARDEQRRREWARQRELAGTARDFTEPRLDDIDAAF